VSVQTKSARASILDAAATAFAEYGVDQTSIDDISRTMNASKGKIYHHFGSKGELICAIVKHSVQLTLDRVGPYFYSDATPSKKLHEMAQAHVTAMISELAYHRVVIEEMRGSKTDKVTVNERMLRSEITALQTDYENMFRKALEAGIKLGQFRKQDLSVTIPSLLMILHAPIYWYEPRGGENISLIAAQLADMAVGAVSL
jgi:AcrR family transcriptional regulator|tara:strand:- start:3401 stop:4003 length:603 start_codon:yes stop_codon:yes gene_type:complete